MTRYLLPCVCGRRIPVAASQAGEQLQCECGQKLEVPTLRHLAALDRLEQHEVAPRRDKSWGARQGLVFLGASIISFSRVFAGYGFLIYLQLHKLRRRLLNLSCCTRAIWFRPDAPPLSIDTMSAADGWKAWELLHVIQRPLHPYYEMGPLTRYKDAMDNWEGLRLAALVAAGAGVLLINIGLFLVRGSRRGRVLL